jgi:hypothetical protein
MTNEELAGMDELVGRLQLGDLAAIPEAATALQSLTATAREAEALRAENARLQARADAARRQALEEAIDRMGWPEIHAFEDELRKGQGVREDAGGFMLRAIKALFGLKPDTVETYRNAMRAMLKENPNAG